ncbi:SRPBCC family protein [Nocardia pseudovaccinii]|uniref:SRPBCC family protein n=1 Tax=Nocardia pseudovaccinii TaxID=189540 RepID=UPI0007A4EC1F|nr:SRPBCC family protein [Nocardia pseudovaccinii]
MVEINIVKECAAPAAVAWEYVADYRNLEKFLQGLESLVPTGDRTRGLGAQFDGTMKFGPVSLSAKMEYTAWEEDRLLASRGVEGVDTTFTYRFVDLDENRCRVDLLIELRLPGVSGRMTAKALEPFLGIAAQRTGEKLSRQIADYHRTRRATEAAD